jgi:hypothetical protein
VAGALKGTEVPLGERHVHSAHSHDSILNL